ncbi:MAG: hypothetical protein LC132_09460, partial [Burkholderiales bacterium]|nr:hypothetical protein [Burkholderiales bacterium]
MGILQFCNNTRNMTGLPSEFFERLLHHQLPGFSFFPPSESNPSGHGVVLEKPGAFILYTLLR